MMKRGFWKMPTAIVAFGLAFAMVLTGCPTGSSDDNRNRATMLESAHPNNDFGTTAIILEFNGPVALTPENVLYFPGTGDIRTGDLTGSGSRWALEVTVMRYGVVSIWIEKEGISNETHEVLVHPVIWHAEWNDTTPDNTKIMFDFIVPITRLGLAAENIELIVNSGAVTRGGLTEIDGRRWSLDVAIEGDVPYILVQIYRDGIAPFGSRESITPYRVLTSVITLDNAVIEASQTAGEKELVLTFSKPVMTLAVENIKITAGTGNFKMGNYRLTAENGLRSLNNGINWAVPVTIENPGGVANVSINRPGISTDPVEVEVPGVYLVSAVIAESGADGQKSLVLTFSGPVPNLEAANIIVHNDTGSFILGRPDLSAEDGISGSDGGRIWTVPITVVSEGQASVSVDKSGVPADSVQVTVPSLIHIVSASFQPGDTGSRWIEFTLSQPVPGLERANVNVANGTGALTLAAGPASLQGVSPWTVWRVDVASIQREGNVLLNIVNKNGVSTSAVTVYGVSLVYVIKERIINSWDTDLDLPAGVVLPSDREGTIGLKVVLSHPVAVAPIIDYLVADSSYTLNVTSGEVIGSGTTWVLLLTVTNRGLPDGNWRSGRLNDITVRGQVPAGSPAGTLGHIRTLTNPMLWGLVGPGAPTTWTDPDVLPEIGIGWNLSMIDW